MGTGLKKFCMAGHRWTSASSRTQGSDRRGENWFFTFSENPIITSCSSGPV